MTTQQPLFTERDQAAPPAGDEPGPVWLQRMSLFMLVLFCLYIGAVLALLPWFPRFWEHGAWLLGHPGVLHLLRQGWMRGLVSGVGLLDMWIGVSEAMHYREARRRQDA